MQTLSQSIDQYLELCEYERELSADTLKAYRIDLQQFSGFTGGTWADRNLLNQYIKHLNAGLPNKILDADLKKWCSLI